MIHHSSLINTVVLGFVLAFILGALAQRMRLSPLVGYLLAGVVAGPFTPGFVADQALVPQLAELGVILLMFGVGLHFSPQDLMAVRHVAIPGAIVQIAIATLLGGMMTWWLGWSLSAALVFGLALSTASTVVLLRSLEERRLLDTTRGKIAIGWLIVEDMAMVLALVILPALASISNNPDSQAGEWPVWMKLVFTIGKVAVFVVAMLLFGRRMIPWILERMAGTGSKELFTLAVLAIALGVALGAAYLFGVSFALGAFFAGMMLNGSRLSHQAAQDSLPLRDAFAVLFFVSVGMLLDPHVLINQPLLVLMTFLIITVGKSLAALALVLLLRRPLETAMTIAVSLAQIGEFSFILAGLGVELGMLSSQGRDLILAAAILSILTNPLMFLLLDRWLARRTGVVQQQEKTPGAPALVPLPVSNHAIVVGYGSIGAYVVSCLQKNHIQVLVIENDAHHAESARERGIPVILGNAASEEVLNEASPQSARMALISSSQVFESGAIASRLTQANPGIIVVARAHSDEGVQYLLKHGAHGTVMEEKELAYSMAEMALAGERFAQRGLWARRPGGDEDGGSNPPEPVSAPM